MQTVSWDEKLQIFEAWVGWHDATARGIPNWIPSHLCMWLSCLRPRLFLFPFCFSLQFFCLCSPSERRHTGIHTKVLTKGNHHFWRYHSREKQKKLWSFKTLKVTEGTTLQRLSANKIKGERSCCAFVTYWEGWWEDATNHRSGSSTSWMMVDAFSPTP